MLEMPLFPLHTVLFPGMPLQLHIFEERYLQMARFCQESNLPFGVVLIEHGVEANGPLAVPHRIGCSAEISRLESVEGERFNLLAVGHERFRIESLSYEKPYLTGNVTYFPLETGNPEAALRAESRLRPWVDRYVRLLASNSNVENTLKNIPKDPLVFAYLAAVILQMPPHQKQPFLEIEFVVDLLEELHTAYRRELALLDRMIAKAPPQTPTSFSLN